MAGEIKPLSFSFDKNIKKSQLWVS